MEDDGRRPSWWAGVGTPLLLYTVCSILFGLIKNQAVFYFGIRDAWYNNELFFPVSSLSVLYTEHNVTLSRTPRDLPAIECVQVQDNTVVEMLWFSLGSLSLRLREIRGAMSGPPLSTLTVNI